MTPAACPSQAELLAYEDEELPPLRQAEVQTHVRQCCDCSTWLNESRTVGYRIRRSVARVDADDASNNPAAWRARLAARRPMRQPGPESVWLRVAVVPALALCLVLVVTLGMTAMGSGSVVEGGSTFARWLGFEPFIQRVTPDQNPDQIPVAPDGAVQPSALPFDLGLIGEEVVAASVQRHYVAPNGLWIYFSAERDAPPAFVSSGDLSRRSIEILNGREVLLEYSLLANAVTLMSWTDGDVLMVVLVMEQPDGYLNTAGALEIVAALIDEGVEVP